MKLQNTKGKINKDKKSENTPHLEITAVVLTYCNIASNYYQPDSRFLYTFVSNKFFGQLLDISPQNFIILKTFDSEFSYTEVWFTDKISKLLEIEDKTSIA